MGMEKGSNKESRLFPSLLRERGKAFGYKKGGEGLKCIIKLT